MLFKIIRFKNKNKGFYCRESISKIWNENKVKCKYKKFRGGGKYPKVQ